MTQPRDPTDRWRESVANDFATLERETTSTDAHPDEDVWIRLACDELATVERDRLLDHAFACESCAATLRAVTEVREGAAAIDAAAPRASGTRPFGPYVWLAAAAVLAIAIGGATMLRFGRATPSNGDPIASASPSEETPSARSKPRAWARLDTPPEVRLPADLALAVRGSDQDRAILLEAFGQAIAPYRAGQFGVAADRLAPLAARRPDVPEFAFYLGVARLFAGDPSSAVAPLRQARASPTVSSDAQWHEAIALERIGRRDEADDVLRALCVASNPYQARACASLKGGS